MKVVSSQFKEEIAKLGKQINFKLAIHTNDKIITENNKFIMTEDNRSLVVEQFNENEIDEYITDEDIYNVSVVRQGNLLSTMMQELDFEVKQDLRVGDTIDASFGLLVDNDYEWVNYGRFMIYSKEKNEDTNTYSYVAYDSMMLTMIKVEDRTSIEDVEIGTAIDHICMATGLFSNVDYTYPNVYNVIETDTFKDMDITYRDVLDFICQCLGVSMVVNNKTLNFKEPTQAKQRYKSKNLYSIQDYSNTIYGIDVVVENGEITLNGTSNSGGTINIPSIVENSLNGTYTISTNYVSGSISTNNSGNINLRNASNNSVIQGTQTNLKNETSTNTITLNTGNISFGIFISAVGITFNNYKIRPQLELGEEVSQYEPYYDYIEDLVFDEQYLKDTNVKFGEKYGPINSVVLSRSEDNDNIYRRDEESIKENGLCEFKIKDNLIMLGNDREDYIDEIFEQLNGLEFYENDFSSTGITYLEPLDMYEITRGDKTYKCLLLNDNIKIQQGLEEIINTEKPEETTTNYSTSSKTDKEVSFIVDKQKANINAKVSKGEVINEINLDESGASINAEKISLAGKEIKLTSDDITIKSTNFNVTKDGEITAKSGKIANWNIDDNKGLYNGTGNAQAGIGVYGNTHAFWAGNEDSSIAPFHVGHDGNVLAVNLTTGDNLYVGQNQNQSEASSKGIFFKTGTNIERYVSGNMDFLRLNSPKAIQSTINGNNILSIMEGFINMFGVTHIYPDGNNEVASFYNNQIQFAFQPIITSDKRCKENIKKVDDVSWIDNLKIKEYEYKNSKGTKQIGLIAQDYIDKEYSKYFLSKNENDFYGIRYNDITNALIKYCQDMKKQLNEQQEQIEELKQEIKSLKGDE